MVITLKDREPKLSHIKSFCMKSFFLAAICTSVLMSCGNSNKISSDTAFQKLKGKWQLNYITGSRISFDGLYPEEKPTITFEISEKQLKGNTSCNTFSDSFDADAAKISFKEPVLITKMACPGEGEAVFLRTLVKINSYDVIEGYTLSLLADGVASMRFTKVK